MQHSQDTSGRLFADHPVDLVITIGAPAANFVQRYQQTLFPTSPELLTDVEERKLASRLTPNETAVAISVSIPAMMENILRVQPRTSMVAVVIGNSPLEKNAPPTMGPDIQPTPIN